MGTQRPREDDALDVIADDVVRQIATVTAARTVARLEEFATARAHERAADGVDATFAALREGRIGTLLVHDDAGDERQAFFGLEASQVASTADDLSFSDSVKSARLVDAAIRAALGTGAGVHMVPAHGPNVPTDGLGGLLRF